MTASSSPVPMGAYSLTAAANGLLFVAGMTPRDASGAVEPGVVGADLTTSEARAAARRAAERALAGAADAPGFDRAVGMTVFVRCTQDFTELSTVGDGASEAIAAWSPERAMPARAVVGVTALPGGAPVEVQLVLGTTG